MGDVIDIIVNLDAKGFEKGSKQLKGAIKSMGTSAKQIGRMAKSAVKSIIGIGSAYMIISKAVSTYMAQNEKLSAQMNGVWTALGNLLGPIIERIIGWVTTAVSYLLSFMKLLGITAKSASQLSKSAKSAGSEMKKTIAGFDELNTLSDNSSSGGANGQLKDVDPTEFMKKIQELIAGKKWRELGKTIIGKIQGILVGLPKKLSEIIKKVNWKGIGNAIREFLKGIFDGINISEIILAWSDFLHDLWNAFLDLLWGLISDDTENEPPIITALRHLGDAIHGFVETVVNVWNDTIKPALKEMYEQYLKPIIDWLMEIGLPALIDEIAYSIESFGQVLSGDKSIVEWLGEVFAGLCNLVDILLGSVDWDAFFTKLKKDFEDGWKSVKKWFHDTFTADGKFTFQGFLDGILKVFTNIKNWIKEHLVDPFVKGFESHLEIHSPSRVMENIGQLAIEGFLGGIKNIWERVISWATGAVKNLLGIFDFDWKLPSLKLPHITVTWEPTGDFARFFGVTALPHLGVEWYARGGIVNGATLIGAGEDGKEAIVPLERNTEWINMVAKGLLDRLEEKKFHVNNETATIDAIADRVSFKMPQIANGTTTPYSVAASNTYNSSTSGETEILRLLEEFYDLLRALVEELDNIQFVAQFDDLRALAKRITKEQKRQLITEGR